MRKMDNVGYYNKKTGEPIEENIVNSIKDEDRRRYITKLFYTLKNNPRDLTIDNMNELRRLAKLKDTIKLDFKKDAYFTVKNSFEFIRELSIHSRGVIYTIGHMITHDGRLKYKNNHLVANFENLREYLNVSKKVWSTYVKPDIDKYNIIVKEKVNNKWCLLINPLFAVKDRTVTETMFIAFYESLEQYLHPIDFLYLKKLHGIEVKKYPEEEKSDEKVS